MPNRKMLALLLSAALLLPLTSCGDTATETTADTAAADTAPVETETEKLPSGLPDMDLNGFVLTFLRSASFFVEKGIWTEELTGDAPYMNGTCIWKKPTTVPSKYRKAPASTPTETSNSLSWAVMTPWTF